MFSWFVIWVKNNPWPWSVRMTPENAVINYKAKFLIRNQKSVIMIVSTDQKTIVICYLGSHFSNLVYCMRIWIVFRHTATYGNVTTSSIARKVFCWLKKVINKGKCVFFIGCKGCFNSNVRNDHYRLFKTSGFRTFFEINHLVGIIDQMTSIPREDDRKLQSHFAILIITKVF